jgi:hypothetical protein
MRNPPRRILKMPRHILMPLFNMPQQLRPNIIVEQAALDEHH